MSIPLSILLYPYLALLLVWLFFMLAGIYHMLRFGFKGVFTVGTTIFFVLVAVLLLAASASLMADIDWQSGVLPFGQADYEKPNILGY